MNVFETSFFLDELLDEVCDFARRHFSHNSKVNPVPNPRLAHYVVQVVLKVNLAVHLVKFDGSLDLLWQFSFAPLAQFFDAISVARRPSRIEKFENGHLVRLAQEADGDVLWQADHDHRIAVRIFRPA